MPQIAIRFEQADYDQIKRAAAGWGITLSDYGRLMLKHGKTMGRTSVLCDRH